ncbi:unnamed protein product, partial [Brachionus calyciflorus]
MGRAKSNSLRSLVISHHNNKKTPKEIYDLLVGKVSLSTVYEWINLFKKTGRVESLKSTGRKRTVATRANKQKKIFTIDGGLNIQNHRVYAYSREDADEKGGIYGLTKFPLSVMVWVGLTKNRSTGPYFIEKGKTVDSNYYVKKILPFAKREGNRLFGSDKW